MIIVWPDNFPFMAGAQTKPPVTSTDKKTKTGRKPISRTIRNIDDLEEWNKNWDKFSVSDMLIQLGKDGYQIAPAFYQSLQSELLLKEAETGASVSSLAQPTAQGTRALDYAKSVSPSTRNYLAEQQAADAAALERAQLQAQIDRERIAEDRRQNLLNNARALVEQQMQAKSQAQTQGVTLAGDDPFRFIGQLRGQDVAAGVQTPYDIFKGYLQGQATQQSPNITANSTTADLESALGKLQTQQPTAPSFGFAGGGTAGTMGPYEARLVGEAGSQIAPGTEVMITGASIVPRPGETTILPLQSGMQEGGVLKPGSLGVLPQLFEGVRQGLGNTRAGFGFLPEGSNTVGRLGGGYGALTTPLSQNLKRGYGELVGLGKISQQDADFVTNAIGELPAPRNAATWFSTLTPTEREAVLSLYSLAGIPQEEFDAMVESAVIKGAPRSGISLAA